MVGSYYKDGRASPGIETHVNVIFPDIRVKRSVRIKTFSDRPKTLLLSTVLPNCLKHRVDRILEVSYSVFGFETLDDYSGPQVRSLPSEETLKSNSCPCRETLREYRTYSILRKKVKDCLCSFNIKNVIS